jgi:hypothetical protein
MPQISISGTIIEFPSSGSSPNWSEAVIQFAELVAAALNSLAGPFDVTPQIFVVTSDANSNVNLPNLSFPTSSVIGAFIRYAITRTTSLGTVSEVGNLMIVYNATASVGHKWQIARDYVGDAQVTFAISDTGQISFSSTALGGTSPTGIISYEAKALLNS